MIILVLMNSNNNSRLISSPSGFSVNVQFNEQDWVGDRVDEYQLDMYD